MGAGTVVKNGGRVMKNVTGYDLVKLLAGSRGALGVLTEVSFKVQALPEAEATLVVEGLGDEAGLASLLAHGAGVALRCLGWPRGIRGAEPDPGRGHGGIGGLPLVGQLRDAGRRGDVTVAEGGASAALWREDCGT